MNEELIEETREDLNEVKEYFSGESLEAAHTVLDEGPVEKL